MSLAASYAILSDSPRPVQKMCVAWNYLRIPRKYISSFEPSSNKRRDFLPPPSLYILQLGSGLLEQGKEEACSMALYLAVKSVRIGSGWRDSSPLPPPDIVAKIKKYLIYRRSWMLRSKKWSSKKSSGPFFFLCYKQIQESFLS